MTLNYKENLFDFKKSGIYFISCIKKEKYYIGESENVRARLCAHKNKLRRNINENRELQSDFNKYGEHFFLFQKLIFGNGVDKENRLKLETLILLTLKPQNRYNIYINWKKRDQHLNSFFNNRHTTEARKLQSIAKQKKISPFKGRNHNNEIKKMLSQIKINSSKTNIERRKPVIIDSIYYESISEASKKTGLNRRLIRERCHDTTRFENFKWG